MKKSQSNTNQYRQFRQSKDMSRDLLEELKVLKALESRDEQQS